MKLLPKTLVVGLAAGAFAASGLAQNATGSANSPSRGGSTSGSNSTLGAKVPATGEGASLGGVGTSARRGNAAVNDTLFERLDANHDGFLSKEELAKVSTMTGSTESGTKAYPSHGAGKDAKQSGVKPGTVPQ